MLPIIETSDADFSEAEDGSLAVIAETDEASMSKIQFDLTLISGPSCLTLRTLTIDLWNSHHSGIALLKSNMTKQSSAIERSGGFSMAL